MLRLRLLTALVLIPPLLAALFYLDARWIAVIFGIVIMAGAWEWSALAEIRSTGARLTYVVALVGAGALLLWVVTRDMGNAILIAAVSVLFWLVALIELIRQGSAGFGLLGTRVGKLAAGAFVLLPTWVSAYYLHATDTQAPMLLLWLLVIVWVADSAAYFAGKTVGRHKLAPTVSPGKTIEGVFGGLLGVMLVAALAGAVTPGFSGEWLLRWVVLGVAVALVSVLGDLVESKYKRMVGVKDSGRLLPGHGGVLDRIDAITSAAPAFVLGWYLLFANAR